jgi:hypothetical protein
MSQVVSFRRRATPARWQAALGRAMAKELRVYLCAGTGAAVVTSGRMPHVVYETDGIGCSCEAAMLGGDPVCQHRAAYWHHVGLLDPEPEPTAPAAAPVRCPDCYGDGYRKMYTGGRSDEWWSVQCRRCGGAGIVLMPGGAEPQKEVGQAA